MLLPAFWIVFVVIWSVSAPSIAQQNGYFVQLRDKNESPYTISNPQTYLSTRAIERRQRQHIDIDNSDLPVSPAYIQGIEACGVKIKHASKWINGVILFCDDAAILNQISTLPYVASIEKTKEAPNGRASVINKNESALPVLNKSLYSDNQLEMLNGNYLHQRGFTGEGMQIAILDAGFLDVDITTAFNHLFAQNRILGTKDFVASGLPFYRTDNHGLHVLSIMAGKIEGQYTGSAPDAGYYLFLTEDQRSEYPVEADYWICAAELADSLGADIVQSSLGYYYFDNPAMSYTHTQLNGTTRISMAASMAVAKGMVVVNSAGNEAANPWRYVIMPSDSPDILTVGAVSGSGERASFSSEGYPDYHITKPDVMAMGLNTGIVTTGNRIGVGNGTSYACPLVSGLAACLWQAAPQKSAREIIQIIRQSGSQWQTPNYLSGYGIPNFRRAMTQATPVEETDADRCKIYPNPFKSSFTIACPGLSSTATISINAMDGSRLWQRVMAPSPAIEIVPDVNIPAGMYILSVKTNNFAISKKLYKQ